MFRICFILFFLYPIFARSEDSRLLEFTLNGKQYYLVLLAQNGTESTGFRNTIYKIAENFMIDEYLKRGTLDAVRDKEMIQALRTTETINDGRSNLLVIFEAENGKPLQSVKDLGTPKAMIRVAQQTREKMLLPFEERLATRGYIKPREMHVVKEQQIKVPLDLILYDGKSLPLMQTVTGSTGGKIEMKNFVIAKEGKENWFPLILQMVERSGWTSISEPYIISDVYLETGGDGLINYYKRLGFKVVEHLEKDPDVTSKGTAIMHMTREEFRTLAENAANRDGKLLNLAKFKDVRDGWQGLPAKPRTALPFLNCPDSYSEFY